LPRDAKPLGPESVFVTMTGPLTGTGLTPGGTKACSVFLSPITGYTLGRAATSGFSFEPGSMVGYGTCLGPEPMDDDFFGATSASGGGPSTGFWPASIDGALTEVRRALRNLVDQPALATELPQPEAGSPERIKQALAYLSQPDPGVVSLVVTGPTSEILGFLDEAEATWTAVLAVDLYNWSIPVCGR